MTTHQGQSAVRAARESDAAEIVHLGALMYKSVGQRPTPAWAVESTELVKHRLGMDLIGMVVDAPEGGLACCGLVNVVPRLPRPGAASHYIGYVQWVSTAPQHQRTGYARKVMDALLRETEHDLVLVECFQTSGNRCAITTACVLRGALWEALEAFLAVLDRYTLADLAAPQRELAHLLDLQPRAK